MNPLLIAQGHTAAGELHPRKADKATPTQCKLHTQLHSKHHPCILPRTTQCAATAGQGPRATPPQPPPTGATGQTPSSVKLTTEPPTPHQDGTNSPGKRFPASGKYSGLASPTMPPQPHRHITSLPLQR
ncbi:hypothetical protein CHARACLAT_028867 [Characodon lateralis]|uniref:Uncharacterized protein n=1 Tax=Characodon lateralis TaxID=208331 RepID=A0ABU7F6W6_9TELE|nr:hypothetical protein [Characodon lateralis]